MLLLMFLCSFISTFSVDILHSPLACCLCTSWTLGHIDVCFCDVCFIQHYDRDHSGFSCATIPCGIVIDFLPFILIPTSWEMSATHFLSVLHIPIWCPPACACTVWNLCHLLGCFCDLFGEHQIWQASESIHHRELIIELTPLRVEM